MNRKPKLYLSVLFLIAGLIGLVLSRSAPIGDFGNYYYGSRLLLDGKFDLRLYTDIHYFNQQITSYGETQFFENYIPVPPFSALFYTPFCIFSSHQAKLVFNLLGLLLFCLSTYRLQQVVVLRSRLTLLLPLVFFIPIYNNLLQGQTYLLITSLLIESFILSRKKRWLLPGLYLSLAISLKLFPAFALLFFLLNRDYRTAIATSLFTLLLCLVTAMVVPSGIVSHYLGAIVPRLADNDVVGAFYYGNQSLYSMLLHLFCYDELTNAAPLAHAPWLIALLEAALTALLVSFLIPLKRREPFLLFCFTLLSGLLLNRYTTSYGMLTLFPLGFLILSEKTGSLNRLVAMILIVGCVSLPSSLLGNLPTLLRYSRFWLLLIVLIFMLLSLRVRWSVAVCAILLPLVFIFRYFQFPVVPADYFPAQNSIGLLYDVKVDAGALLLKSSLGYKDTVQKIQTGYHLREDSSLLIKDNVLFYKDRVLCETIDNKKKPFLLGDSAVVFMSDQNQGIGFYKLRVIPLTQ